MPDSQSQTPGDSFAISERARLETLLLRAGDLEQQLANLKKADEQTAAGLRSHLCEVLSDIIISDPSLSWENDCAGKLWRSCFYAPIVVWRKKLSREKKRQGSNLKTLEQNFKRFLCEALTLYDYLVVQYQSKILSTTPRRRLPEQSQLSVVSSIDADPVEHDEGIIPGLFRLFIHMGDLHRYAESFSKAETYYLYASRLAPGMGNPYNQLAVVSQLKDPNLSCVALYWYCRSLLATHDSFETSTSNLERLFDMNRTYLEEHSRTVAPPLFSQTTKKMSSDMLRAEKAAITKACLAHFVDFHYDLFKESRDELNTDTCLRTKMDGIIRSLESLVHASAFGDSLLVKMVLINTFSVERAKKSKVSGKLQVAKDFFSSFGRILVDRLNVGLSSVLEKAGKQPNTIRFLQPLLIQLEFVRQEVSAIERASDVDFLHSVTLAASNMRQLYSISEISELKYEATELSMLKGYKPFAALNSSYCQGSPFVDADDAVYVLDLQPTQSQPISKQKDDNFARVAIFIKASEALAQNDRGPTVLGGTPSLKHDASMSAAAPTINASEDCRQIAAATDEGYSDEGGDLVIEINPAQQQMVELSRNDMPTPIGDASVGHGSMQRNNQGHYGANDSSFNLIRPPPGFEGSTAFLQPALAQSLTCSGPVEVCAMPERHSIPYYHSIGPGGPQYANDSKLYFHDANGLKQNFRFGRTAVPDLSSSFLNPSTHCSNNPFHDRATDVASVAAEGQTSTFPPYQDNTPLSNLSWLEGIWQDDSATRTQNPFAN